MNEKDLFNGMNHIDDEIIKEAMQPVIYEDKKKLRWKKIIRRAQAVGTVAAVLAVVVLGHEVASLNNKIESMQSEQSGYTSGNGNSGAVSSGVESPYAGIASEQGLGDMYDVAKNYGEVFDKLAKNEEPGFFDKFFGVKGELNDGGLVYEEMMDAPISSGATAENEDVAVDSSSASDSASNSGYSKTNVMTDGVDESDIVKTDGKFIYMVESGRISITDISGGAPGEATYFSPDFEAPSDVIKEMYVDSGKLILITSHITDDVMSPYAYDTYWSQGTNEQTFCYSYDISNPKDPQFIGKAKQDGSYNTSRKIGDIVYMFSNRAMNRPNIDKDKALEDEKIKEWVPMIDDKPIGCGCIFIGNQGQNGTLISSFNINEPEKNIDSKYVMNGYSEVYVSNDAIYFYQNNWGASREITKISKMSFADGVMTAGEATSVNGSILDSFAISQQNGYLYVLATEDDSDYVNTLHVFDSNLKQTGVINEIARGERVYAARFIGKTAYFITYRQVDPLFVADISDPSNPKLLGELEVEGFSEYLHLWDEKHVLGIGFMTQDNARAGIKLTMFDVTDPSNPKEENYMILENEEYSNALSGDYKAILASPEKNLIGFASEGYNNISSTFKNSYYLLSYDKVKGFSMVKATELKHNIEGYRGLYSGDNFYIAGNSDIEYFSLK